MDGGVQSERLNKKLRGILNKLAIDRSLLDNYAQYIMHLLEAGANPNVQNQAGKTLSHYLDKRLSDILDQLEQHINLLDNSNNTQYIMLLLGTGANPNVQNQAGKTLSYYLDKKLRDILNQLESNRSLLDNYAQYIMFLLQAGANPNIQNQAGKTLLHYAAKNNCLKAIELLLKAKADPNVRDHSGRTPFKYVIEPNCLQVLKDWGYDLGDSHGNEGNSATPDGSVDDCSNSSGDDSQIESVKLSDCNTEEDSDYHSDGSCENEENPAKSPNNDNRTPTDQQTSSERPVVSDRDSEDSSDYYSEDEDLSSSSSDYLFLEDSLLAKLGIPLTTDERGLIGKFCKEIGGITKQEPEENILKSIEKIVDGYLKEGIRLNSSCSNDNDNGDKETVTSLIFKEMEEVIAQLRVNPRSSTAMLNTHDYTDESDGNEYKASDIIIKRITSNLLLKGGMGKKFLSGDTELTNKHYDFDYLDDLKRQYKDREEKLISIACEGIVNKSKQTHEYDLKAEIENQYFYVKYSQDSIIEPAKILNHEKAKELNLKVGILQIGESIVKVESIDGKTNYKDILKGSIKMSFTTEVGEINIYLSSSKEGGNKIKVEIDEENKAKFNKLKDKSSLGKNCLLEGENVSEVISKNFKMSDSVSTEPTETTKDVPFTDLTQACLQQIDTSVKGRQ